MASKPLRRARLAMAALALLWLAACGASPESRSILMAAPPADAPMPESTAATGATDGASMDAPADAVPAPPPEDVTMNLSVAARSLSSGYAGDENGCYSLLFYDDGSADICYFDYAARQRRLLEALPRQGAAFGRLTGIHGNATPVLAGGHLFLFRQRSAAANAQAAITRLNPDGSAPETVTFDPAFSLQLASAALWDGEALYFIATESADDAQASLLMRLDAAAMQAEELFRFETGFEYSIEGFWEKGPVVCAAAAMPPADDAGFNEAWENRGYSLFTHGMLSGEQQGLKVWTQGTATSMQNNVFYYWQPDAAELRAIDANTGADTVLAAGFAPDSYTLATMSAMLDGRVRIQFSANQGRTLYNYTISAETGEVAQPPVENLGENIHVLAEAEGFFLVQSGDRFVRREQVDPGYDPQEDTSSTYDDRFVSVSEYALIGKAGYWAGSPDFIAVEDLVY